MRVRIPSTHGGRCPKSPARGGGDPFRVGRSGRASVPQRPRDKAIMTDPFSDNREAQQFLTGGSVSAVFPKVGHVHEGTVLSFAMKQQTSYDTGEPLVWKDGSKRMQLSIVLQGEPTGKTWKGMAYEETEVPNDDGQRTLYAKGNLQKAIGQVLKDQGVPIEVGGYLKVVRGKNGPKTDPKYAPPYTYTAEWTPAAKNSHAATAALTEGDPFAS